MERWRRIRNEPASDTGKKFTRLPPISGYFLTAQGLQGLHGFLAAQGLQGLQGLQGFLTLAAQGLHGLQGLQGFLAAQGLQGLQGFFAAWATSDFWNTGNDISAAVPSPQIRARAATICTERLTSRFLSISSRVNLPI